MTVLHAAAEKAAERPTGAPRATCPECGLPFTLTASRQMFCSPAHKATFHNRQTVRGRVLTPLSIADRITRGGSRGDKVTGRAARGDAQKLMDRWAADDREAGRMSMTEYVRRRKALGYELP
jgi:hypothetical protein